MLVPMPIRDQIKKARKEVGISQGELASRCRTHGVSIVQGDISDYENGKRNPSLVRLEVIAKVLSKEWELRDPE